MLGYKSARERLDGLKWYGVDQSCDEVKVVRMDASQMTPSWTEDDMLVHVGMVAGECYGSSTDSDKCLNRALSCAKNGHHSPFEHFVASLKFTVDRGTSHALVRHRHCAFQQGSTIYQRYDNGIAIVGLPSLDPCIDDPVKRQVKYIDNMDMYKAQYAEYRRLIEAGIPHRQARDVLPTCLATNIIITTNLRQWMYMIQRRIGPGDAVRMHVWAMITRAWFECHYPKITDTFDAWYERHPL